MAEAPLLCSGSSRRRCSSQLTKRTIYLPEVAPPASNAGGLSKAKLKIACLLTELTLDTAIQAFWEGKRPTLPDARYHLEFSRMDQLSAAPIPDIPPACVWPSSAPTARTLTVCLSKTTLPPLVFPSPCRPTGLRHLTFSKRSPRVATFQTYSLVTRETLVYQPTVEARQLSPPTCSLPKTP